jgi:DNA-binding response OmpR family regulator
MEAGLKVIVVDDDLDLRDSLVEYLNLFGHKAYGVGSCLEFYRSIAEHTFSVAVVDVGLPDQCGYVLAEYIRKNTSMGVVMLTARASLDDRLKGYSTGADQYLVKPVDCREIAAVITNLKSRIQERHSAVTSLPDSSWKLDVGSWILSPPAGNPILLTSKELRFVSCLAEAAGTPVSREVLFSALDYRNDEYASRAMDSLVRRLRRKIEMISGLSNPVKTIHTVGYCFSARLMIAR